VPQLERGVGEAAEGDREPEVHGSVREDGGQGLAVGEAESGQQGHEHELDHPQAPGGDGNGGQDVGQAVRREQVDRRDDVAEGGDEDPERCGVEQPVGRRPAAGPGQESAILHEHREPAGQPLEQRREPVGVQEADPGRHGVDDGAGPLLTAGQEVEEHAECAEQDHTDGGRHHHQDGCGGGAVTVGAGHPESVGDEEGDQRAPEDAVEHDGRADALGAEGEAGVRTGHARLGEQPVAEGGPRGGAPRRDVAEGQCREVDPEEPEPCRSTVGEYRVGELGVGHQCRHLEHHADGQVGDVDVGQGPDLAAMAGQQGQGHVEDEEEDEDGADAEPDLPAHERPAVPPPASPNRAHRLSLRHRCRLGHHRVHVATAQPLGPAMLRA